MNRPAHDAGRFFLDASMTQTRAGSIVLKQALNMTRRDWRAGELRF